LRKKNDITLNDADGGYSTDWKLIDCNRFIDFAEANHGYASEIRHASTYRFEISMMHDRPQFFLPIVRIVSGRNPFSAAISLIQPFEKKPPRAEMFNCKPSQTIAISMNRCFW